MIQRKPFWISCACMIVAIMLIYTMRIGADVVVVEKNLDKIPYSIGGYEATDILLEDSVETILDTDVYIFRNYSKGPDKSISLYIGYYGTRKGGRSTHSPAGCYPGSGWGIMDEQRVLLQFSDSSEDRLYEVNMMQVSKENSRQLVFHWYQTNQDQVMATGIRKNLSRFKNRIIYHRNDGAFVRVSQKINDTLAHTKADLEQFIQAVFPLIVENWPIEKEM